MPLLSIQENLAFVLNSTFYLSILCFLGVLFVFKITRRSKTNSPPSPPKLPFIGNLHQLGTFPHRSLQTLSHKYGPIMMMKLGQIPTLVISSADVAREIFKNHDAVFSNRPLVTASRIFCYGFKDVAFAPYDDEWRQKRKICVLELLSMKRVQSFQPIRESLVAEMLDTIRDVCMGSKSSTVNLSEMLIAASNNLNSTCIFGQKFDTEDGSGGFGDLGRKMMSQFAAFCVGDYWPSLSWIDTVSGQTPDFKATLRAFDVFFDKIIAEHKAKMKKNDEQSDKKDFMDILLELQEDDRLDFELTQDTLKALMVDMIIGGSDTSSTTMEWVFTELMRNPSIMKKVQEELRRVVRYKTVVDENDMKQMNYLKCVLKETLRLHPPVPLLVPRETTSSVKLRGYDIPSKTRVIMNAFAIQRDPEVWDKADEFYPDRFENSEVEFKTQDVEFIAFGNGRRGCPGISFGVNFSMYVIANLLYWFDWKLPESVGHVKDIDMSERYGLTVNKKVPLHLEPVPYSF
ncbi:PREDICTED: cytochrome P450 71A1-like [Lupinus angustifolius]|nr:PREDICTED: cytochrome P450 71A1-like [Lupinus angustifolius]